MNTSESVPAPLTITMFGPMLVLVEGKPLPPLHSRKAQWLLALLALRPGRPVEREWLAGTLWLDAEQEQAFSNLRPVLSDLRRALGSQSDRLQSPTRHTLSLDLTSATVDVLAFDAAISHSTLASLALAVRLYKGPLLEGCTEEWVAQERNSREQDYLKALGTLAEAAFTERGYSAAADYYRRIVSLDPWDEAARRGLMEALAREGNTNAALQAYRELSELLRNDPRAQPDEQTRALYTRLRTQARERAAELPAHVITDPLPVGKKTAPVVANNLPCWLTELVGREDERLEVAAKLRRSRLVTLTGPGGIGKTRLSLEVAGDCVREGVNFADGVWLVALESLSEEMRVPAHVAAVLGLKEEVGRTALQTLIDHLQHRHMLLVLDNCEHLLGACSHLVSQVLSECAGIRILATSREPLGIIGEAVWAVPPLAVPDPSRLPESHATRLRVLAGYESVQLFVQRAEAVQKSFALTHENALHVAQICYQLDGLPLAIELAAARVKVMTAAQIASRLDERLALLTGGNKAALSRQQTLRASLDWSYALLSKPEQLLLRRLAVFAGGWVLAAAEQSCSGDGLSSGQILDLLTSLVDKSLVTFDERDSEPAVSERRFRLLETVRHYAADLLEASGEADTVCRRYRDYFLALAEETAQQLLEPDYARAIARFEAERDNLRAAIAWCWKGQNEAEDGLRLAAALGQFWDMRGYYTEGRATLSQALKKADKCSRTATRAKALKAAGTLAYYQGDHAEAGILLEELLSIQRELGDKEGAAWALNSMGDVACAQGELSSARTLYGDSLAIFREIDSKQGIASLVHHLGRLERDRGNYAAAKALYEEGLEMQRSLGHELGVAWALHHLGNLAATQGDMAQARSIQEEAAAIFRDIGNKQGLGWALSELGDVAGVQGDYDEALRRYEESMSIFQDLGNKQGVASSLHLQARMFHDLGDYGRAKDLYAKGLSLQRELRNKLGIAWALVSLGEVTLDQGDAAGALMLYVEGIGVLKESGDKRRVAATLEGLASVMLSLAEVRKAVVLWGAASGERRSAGSAFSLRERDQRDQQMARTRALLGEAAYARAWEEGAAMSWEQAAAYALEVA